MGYKMVNVQFKVGSPKSVRDLPGGHNLRVCHETREEMDQRMSRPQTGTALFERVERTSLWNAFREICEGYTPVEAYVFHRFAPNKIARRLNGILVRVGFLPHEEVGAHRRVCCHAIQDLFKDSFWTAEAFDNPFFENGEEVSGERTLSISLKGRIPLTHPNGEPVRSRLRDDKGILRGDPIEILPKNHLRFNGTAYILSDRESVPR